jgi:TolB protein
MKGNILSLAALFVFMHNLYSQQKTGAFDGNEDVGTPVIKGAAIYNPAMQEYNMECGGKNMWAKDDQFRFLWKKIKGDFIISATVRFIGMGTDPHRKIGVIARNNLTANSPYADACVHGDGLTSLQFRKSDTAQTEQIVLQSNGAVNIELQRSGNTFTFSAATPGEN